MRFNFLKPIHPWNREPYLDGVRQHVLGLPLWNGEGGGAGAGGGATGGGQPGAGAGSGAAGGGAGSGAGGGQPGAGDGGAGGGEPVPAWVTEIRQEAGKYRTERNAYRTKVTELENTIKELKGEGGSPGAGDPKRPDEVKQLQEDLRKANERLDGMTTRAKAKTQAATISNVITGLPLVVADAATGKVDPAVSAAAVRLLEGAAKVTDDDRVVFVVRDATTGEEREVEATAEAVTKHNLLPANFFRPAGAQGAGTGQSTADAPPGVDMQRALSDQKYYEQHYETIRAWEKNRQFAGRS